LGAYTHSLSVLSIKEKDFSCPRYEDVLNLGARRRWVVNFAPRPFYPGKEFRYLWSRRLVGPQREENNSLPLPEFEPRTA